MYGIQGAIETGYYFLAFTIFSLVQAFPVSVWGAVFPTLSGLTQGRKGLAQQGITLTLTVTAPLAVVVFTCAPFIVKFFGNEYTAVLTSLNILLVSSLILPLTKGVETLAYARGDYRLVLVQGLVTNIPRLILYVILVPGGKAYGAALAYLAGSISGLLFSIFSARLLSFQIRWRQVAIALLLPITAGLINWLLNLHFIAGVIIILLTCSFGYVKTGIINTVIIKEIIKSVRKMC